MEAAESVILTPRREFADKYSGLSTPQAEFVGDVEGASFRQEATLKVPKLLYLLEQSGGEGAFTHFVVDVWSKFFAENHDWQYEVTVKLDGEVIDKRLFHKWYGRHQFLIPIPSFRRDEQELSLTAAPTRRGAMPKAECIFDVALLMTSKNQLWREFEERAIWVFSTARSGSSWLAMDVLCFNEQARPVDESGVGRMFAPLQWDAERFFDIASRPFHIESGFDYELGRAQRKRDILPLFERVFTALDRENAILSRHNFDKYHQLLKDVVLEHVLNEWGMLDFQRFVFKMPNDSHGADFIMRAFPRSHMVFLMRDGRDVMRSRFSPFSSQILAEEADLELRRYAIAFYSHFWNFQVDIIRSAFEAHPPEKRLLVYYEALRKDPLAAIWELYNHLGYETSDDEIRRVAEATRLENVPESERGPDKPRQTGHVGGFRNTFSEDEIALMEAIMGDNLSRYGYALT